MSREFKLNTVAIMMSWGKGKGYTSESPYMLLLDPGESLLYG